MKCLQYYLTLIFVSFISLDAMSARLKSYCTMPEDQNSFIGQNIDERLPIASVSKLFTSLLAVTHNSVHRKIYTQFYYTQVGHQLFDVHIKGAHEPYFGRESIHWLIAKLNEAGVFKIRNLSFDENFKYYHDPDQMIRIGRKILNPVSGKDQIDAPSPEDVRSELLQNSEVLKNYNLSVKDALLNGVVLPKKIIFKPSNIKIIFSKDFQSLSNTKKGYVASADLLHMLKLMNWNSNNHAANQILQLSGGITAFNQFFYEQLGFSEKDVRFINGSGQNANLDGNGRDYNEATCSMVVRTVRALKKSLEAQDVKLQDAMSVVGGDIGSTVSGKTYNNHFTNLSVVAKTGTIGTNITLAGMISAKTGHHFFFFNVEVNPAPKNAKNKSAWINAEANRARNLISTKLVLLIKKLGGPDQLEYKPNYFNLESFEDKDLPEAPTAD